MKKYIQPSVKTTKIALSQMIAASIGIDNTEPINPSNALGKSHEWEVMDGNEW